MLKEMPRRVVLCIAITGETVDYAIDDDVWVYTGVTSITGDQSNVGFVLMNQRTMETNTVLSMNETAVSTATEEESVQAVQE